MRASQWVRRLFYAAIAIVLAIAAVFFGINWLMSARYDQLPDTVAATNPCQRIPGISQSESAMVDWAHNRAFVSGENARGNIKRGIFLVDLAHGMRLTDITPKNLPIEIHPHGLALFTASDGSQTLFVISHPAHHDDPVGHSVLVFDVHIDGSLTLRKRVTDPALYSPNAVIPISNTQFYVTNDMKNILATFSSYFRTTAAVLGWSTSGNVVFYDGAKFHVVADGLRLANGINISPDKKTIYVAESFGPTVLVYDRDTKTNALSLIKTIALPGSPDNIDVAPDGHLFVALFPRLSDVLTYQEAENSRVPSSAVVEIEVHGDDYSLKPVWLDNGTRTTMITIGAEFAKDGDSRRLLLGTIYTKGDLLACTVSPVPSS